METTMNNIHSDTPRPAVEGARQDSVASHTAGRPGDDVVRWSEFRLALWMGGFALAVILGAQGFLYVAIMNLQRDMHMQFASFRTELQTQIDDLRTELRTELSALRTELNDLRVYVYALSERVARIETHLGITPAPADQET